MVEEYVKHLYLNPEGKLIMQVSGLGIMKGKTKLNDGFEHTIAVKHTFKDLTWSLVIDGK